jgi:Fe-S cluster assembly iron-binding protein IscA
MEFVISSEMSVNIYRTTSCNITDNSHLNISHRENLTSHQEGDWIITYSEVEILRDEAIVDYLQGFKLEFVWHITKHIMINGILTKIRTACVSNKSKASMVFLWTEDGVSMFLRSVCTNLQVFKL